MTEKTIEFEAVYKTAKLGGYVLADELDDEMTIFWYDENGLETCQMPLSCDSEDHDERCLYNAFITDSMFRQRLADNENESKTVDCGYYTLNINGGSKIQMSVEKLEGYAINNRINARISFKFDDVILDNDLLDELAENLGSTWNAEGEYSVQYSKNEVWLEIDNDWCEDSYDSQQKENVEKEMISDAEKVFVKQLIQDKDIYSRYFREFSRILIEKDHSEKFNKNYISDAAHAFEEMLEEISLTEINSFCEKSLKEAILDDIWECLHV